jgi:hypothetical protein
VEEATWRKERAARDSNPGPADWECGPRFVTPTESNKAAQRFWAHKDGRFCWQRLGRVSVYFRARRNQRAHKSQTMTHVRPETTKLR